MFKQTISTVSDHIFPRISLGATFSKKDKIRQTNVLENEITGSCPLQMALFFNIAFFPVWFTTIIVMLPLKYENLPELNKIILVIALTAVVAIEIARLYMGYFGNLKNNIPGLAGFWMLSLLLQAPLQILLLHPALHPSLVEYVTQAIMCTMLAMQLITGFSTLRRIAKHSSANFYASQFFADDKNLTDIGKY